MLSEIRDPATRSPGSPLYTPLNGGGRCKVCAGLDCRHPHIITPATHTWPVPEPEGNAYP